MKWLGKRAFSEGWTSLSNWYIKCQNRCREFSRSKAGQMPQTVGYNCVNTVLHVGLICGEVHKVSKTIKLHLNHSVIGHSMLHEESCLFSLLYPLSFHFPSFLWCMCTTCTSHSGCVNVSFAGIWMWGSCSYCPWLLHKARAAKNPPERCQIVWASCIMRMDCFVPVTLFQLLLLPLP